MTDAERFSDLPRQVTRFSSEKCPPYSWGKGVPLPSKTEGPQELSQRTGLTVSSIHYIWLVSFSAHRIFPQPLIIATASHCFLIKKRERDRERERGRKMKPKALGWILSGYAGSILGRLFI